MFATFSSIYSFASRRQKESEQKSIEDAANRRIEELVAQRVAEELERRKDEIEAEVLRRVEEAKKMMEQQMLEEMERRKQEQIEEARKREVRRAIALLGGMIRINNDRRAGCPWYGRLILFPEARTSSRFIWFYPTDEFFKYSPP